MNPERWAEIGRIFDAAHVLPPDRRPAFLEETCSADRELRSEVESLLASHDRAGSFLERPVVVDLLPVVPRRVGPWEVVEEIGRGGMGVVFKARRSDQGFERLAAVKVVKRGMDTDDILQRFERERRILAGLDHPNIARVVDGGSTEDGLPYFVMELIEGENILAYAGRRRLGIAERLRLFRQVCSAVQYAHQRLVIHRDIKPGNVLVTSEGRVKLLDFGLAKVLGGHDGDLLDRTRTVHRLFTPDYASPEQVRGETLTTASDVYSLGVILYEILTGDRPYRLKTSELEEVTGAILQQEPQRPSAKARLHQDLDAIVLTSLRKEPGRRYASVEQLSEDVRRHLEGLPVRARPDRFGYRAGKFVARHKAGIGAGALAAASLVAALAVSVRQMNVARAERDRERLEAAKARQVSSFLRGLFESSYPRRVKGERLTAQDLIDAGAARVDHDLASQPKIQASMLALLGSVYMEMGLAAKARPLLERSLAMREKLLGKDKVETAESLYFLGRLEARAGEFYSGRSLLERAVAIREREASGPALAEALSELGIAVSGLGDYAQAKRLLERAVAVEEKAGGPNLHKWLTNLADVENSLGNYERERALLERALAIGVRAEGRVDVQVDVTLLNLGSVLRNQEEFDRALPLFEQALADEERTFGKEYDGYGYTLGELGELCFAMGDRARARELIARSIETIERVRGPSHHLIAAPLRYQGRLLLAEGRAREALASFERARDVWKKIFHDENHAQIAAALVDIGRAKRALEGPGSAEAVLRQALAIQRKALPPAHPILVPTLTALGGVLLELRRPVEAEPLLKEAVDIARMRLPERHSERRAAEAAWAAARSGSGDRTGAPGHAREPSRS